MERILAWLDLFVHTERRQVFSCNKLGVEGTLDIGSGIFLVMMILIFERHLICSIIHHTIILKY